MCVENQGMKSEWGSLLDAPSVNKCCLNAFKQRISSC